MIYTFSIELNITLFNHISDDSYTIMIIIHAL